MEKKSLFHDVTFAMIGNYWLVNYDILWLGWSDTEKYFNLEIDSTCHWDHPGRPFLTIQGGIYPLKHPILAVYYPFFIVTTIVAT